MQDEIFQLARAAATTTVSHSLLTEMCSVPAHLPLLQLGLGWEEREEQIWSLQLIPGCSLPCFLSLEVWWDICPYVGVREALSSLSMGRELQDAVELAEKLNCLTMGVQNILRLLPKSKADLRAPRSRELKDVGSGKFASYWTRRLLLSSLNFVDNKKDHFGKRLKKITNNSLLKAKQ